MPQECLAFDSSVSISMFSKLSHLIWSSQFGQCTKITWESRSHFYTFIKLVFKMSLLIREMTVTGVMNCVMCCPEELLVSVCTRQKILARFLLGISSPFIGTSQTDTFMVMMILYKCLLYHRCLSDRGIKECQSKNTHFGQHKMNPLLLHTLEFRSCSRSLQILGIVQCSLII